MGSGKSEKPKLATRDAERACASTAAAQALVPTPHSPLPTPGERSELMPTPVRRRLRLARRGLGYSVAIALVLVALAIGVVNQLLPLAERHPDRIAAWLSARAGRPIAFDRVQTDWTRRGPLLQLDGLRVGHATGGDMITIGDAEMLVSLYAGLLPGTPFSEVRLRGLELTLERLDDGRWQVRGLPGQQDAGGDPLAALEGLGELQVIDGRLTVAAPALGIDTVLPHIDLRLRVDGDRLRAGLRAWMGEGGSALDANLDYDRRSGDGRAYLGSRQADLAAWSSLLQLAGIGAEAGRGRIEAWASVREHRIVVLTLDGALQDVRLRGAPLRAERGLVTRPQAAFDRIDGNVRWRSVDGGWRLEAPLLRVAAAGRPQMLDGLVLAGGARYALLAERIDAGPLLAAAALSDRVAPAWRRWLAEGRPTLTVHDVELVGLRGGALRASGRVSGLGFAAVDDAPGLSGLGGRLRGDADGVSLALDAAAPVRIDWPRGFGVAHEVALDGDIVGWRESGGWRAATSGLQVQGEGYAVELRGGLLWQGDGTRPRIDLAATLDEAPLSVAKGFLVRHRMPAAAVDWLDAALQGGRIHDVRALVAGDLDDWPFRGDDDVATAQGAAVQGVFRANLRISDGVLKFHPDWPALEQVRADVSFVADGFQVDGSGAVAGMAIERFHAGIAQYDQGRLETRADASGDAAAVLDLLRRSPLQARFRDTFDHLAASGPVQVGFELTQPLRRDAGSRRIGGTLDLAGAVLQDQRWKLRFDQVRGRVDYDQDGFRAERLDVRHDGRPGRLSLRAGGSTRDRRQALEAELVASLGAAELLARAPQLDWLQPHVDGRSPWTIALAIPKATDSRAPAPGRLQLRSDLVGTALHLPAPLDKDAGVALASTVDIALPLQRGEIRIALGQRMGLRARSDNGRTGVRIALGSDTVDAPPPASGLVVGGRTPSLDALDWIGLATGGDNGGTMPLRSIDVTAEHLLLLGGQFPDTRVQVLPTASGGDLTVRAQGMALQGELLVPEATGQTPGRTIGGRFQRLHWRSAAAIPTNAAVVAESTPTPARGDQIEPSTIPALAIDADDLRIGDAALGGARLRTRPVAAGMRIEQLQMQAPQQRIDISGEWLGRGPGARTRMTALIDSDDFGALLAGFGFGGRLAGGEGRARFEAAWSGDPAAFELANIEGALVLAVRDGRLLEVEPGAGRVLGLLSIAELPRRLTLDFRDIFASGFAFNSIDGRLSIGDGSARSDDLAIDGPAAEIRIRGVANLRAETFDQTIEVRPRTGNMLTVVGAITGGPVGAAIGAAANAVLSKPLGQAAARTYHVTGPWEDPEVEVVSREQSRIPAAEAAPAG